MKRILREAEFTAGQKSQISALARECGLCYDTISILFGRGFDDKNKIEAYLHPSKEQFLSPFLMSGMKEAVELITRARDEGWSVVIYGDYDADGVCASSIMRRGLADFGVEAMAYVPERKCGYGMNTSSIDMIFEEYFPQLFITVDCGISNAAEVEYIKEQGAEVIVTDHHELPEKLPDCICINPKIADNYPYDNLCGAGVAFKVACALNGKSAYQYLDFTAIATIADSVPLTGENRALVTEGLKLINSHPRKNYSSLFRSTENISAQTIAFSLAPKINAAGRMGDADAALKLFLSSDEREIYERTVKLSEYNTERQACCDELYVSAKQKIKQSGAKGRVIVLWGEDWNAGFVGIIAARLAEEYCRPTLLFVANGDMLKGSARSIDGVNVFEALKSCSDIIEEFGGHSQAAGVNIKKENLSALNDRLNEYFRTHYSKEAFTPTYYVGGDFSGEVNKKFIEELELFEPCGVGNRKPQFVAEVTSCRAKPLKTGSPHLSVKVGNLDLLWFSGERYEGLLKSGVPKRLIFEYNVSYFRGKQQIKGYLHDAVYSTESCAFGGEDVAANLLTLLCAEQVQCEKQYLKKEEIQGLLDSCGEYGTVFIAGSYETLREYDIGKKEVNVFNLSSGSLSAVVLISPSPSCDLSAYENIVWLDDPGVITLNSVSGKTIQICSEINGLSCLSSISCDRAELLSAFRYLSANALKINGATEEDVAKNYDVGASYLQALFSLKVFLQLNLISFKGERLTVFRGVKTQLNKSALYNIVNGLQK